MTDRRKAASHLLLLLLAACSNERPPTEQGPYDAAHSTFTLTDASRARTLTVEAWYPTKRPDAPTGFPPTPVAEYVTDPDRRMQYSALLAAAPAGCPTTQLAARRDAAPEGESWPLVMLSHCHGCTRFELATVAERLASHGLALVAPDHAGNTVFEAEAGTNAPLDASTLELRVKDIRFTLDQVLDPANTAVPETVRGRFDPARVGMAGHSFGSATAGVVTRDDSRIKAVAGLAAPMESPLLPGIVMEDVKVPLLLAVANEDNSIEEIGNDYLRENYENAGRPAWRIDLADAGHFSFTDIAGLREEFMPGCGQGKRHADDSAFTYAPVADAQHAVASWLVAFFGAHLAERPLATDFLASPAALPGVTVHSK